MDFEITADKIKKQSKEAQPNQEQSSSSVEPNAEPPVVWKNLKDGTIVDSLNFNSISLVPLVVNPLALRAQRAAYLRFGIKPTIIYPIRKVKSSGCVELPNMIIYPSTSEVLPTPANDPATGTVQSRASEAAEFPGAKCNDMPEPAHEILLITDSMDTSPVALQEMP